ncbi:MAG: hypothetical protein JZU47_08130 [Prolixibacteraceae bacterium]|nr:hypothetical protein [Prolixibacteraceae bacterium]
MASVLESLKEFNKAIEKAKDLNQVKKTIKYVNINNPDDSFIEFKEAIKRKLNLANYKKVTIIDSPKSDLISMISSNKTLTESDIEILKLAVINAEKLSSDPYQTEYRKLMNQKSKLNKETEKDKIQTIENKLIELKKKYNKI